MSSTGTRFRSTTEVDILANNLNINGGYKLLQGSADPTVSAQDAPAGSLYVNTSTSLIYRKLDAGSSTNWQVLGSGSSSGINYIENGDFEGGTSGAVTYDDGAVAAPIDGEGGTSANLTLSKETTTILRGTGSLKVAKGAADAQGEGVGINFTIDPIDQGRELFISFDYKTTTNFASNDVRVYVYDVTNAALIGPVLNSDDGNVLKADNIGRFYGKFFASSNSLSYRLIFHVTSTNALAYDLIVDTLRIFPDGALLSVYRNDAVIDLTGSGSFTGGIIRVSRVGPLVTVGILDALTYASNSTPVSATGVIPDWALPASTRTNVTLQGTTLNYEIQIASTGSVGFVSRNWSGVLTATTTIGAADITYSVVDDQTNIISSTQAVLDSLSFEVRRLTDQNLSDGVTTKIAFNSVIDDEFGYWDNVNSRYVLKKPVKHLIVNASVQWAANNVGNRILEARISGDVLRSKQLRALPSNSGATQFPVCFVFRDLQANDYVEVYGTQSSGGTLAVIAGTHTYLEIISVPQLSTFGVYRDIQFKSSDSGNYSLATAGYLTNEWAQLSNNSITLEPGVWRIDGVMNISDSTPATADISAITCLLSTANGDNTTTLPTGITVQAGRNETQLTLNASSISTLWSPLTSVRVLITETTTIFANLRANFTSAGASTMRVQLYAEKIA